MDDLTESQAGATGAAHPFKSMAEVQSVLARVYDDLLSQESNAEANALQIAYRSLFLTPAVGRYVVRKGRVVEYEIFNYADERPDGTYTLYSPIAATASNPERSVK